MATLLLSNAPRADAFDADRHRQYTQAALDMYRQVCGVGASPMRDAARERLADGARAEDDWSWARFRNWHFYDRDAGPRNVLFFRATLNEIFKQRSRRVAELLERRPPRRLDLGELYFAAGRVLHYIQDMSVPAHVVPVFHMSGLPDPVDSYAPRDESTLERVLEDSCNDLGKGIPEGDPVTVFEQLLRRTANDTLSAIGQRRTNRPAPSTDAERWHAYWPPHDPASSVVWLFGPYGRCAFARSSDAAPECAMNDRLETFFADRYRRVIRDTVRLLIYLERALPP